MKKLSLLALLCSSCIFVVSTEEQPTSQEAKKSAGEDVTILSVSTTPTAGFIDGYELSVKVSLEVNSKMPLVAPHLEVSADCKVGAEVFADKDRAFFMSLSEATPGNKKEDTATLFKVKTLPQKPERCELTLQLSKGAGTPQSYCYQNDATKPGKCTP